MTTMQRARAPFAATALLSLAAAACTPLAEFTPPDPATVTVDYVVDGDTIDITTPDGHTERVRLLGINAPEIAHDDEPAQCGGEDAAAQLADLLPEGSMVTLATDSRADDEDRYGRLLRYVDLEDGTDAAHALITAGYAYAWAPSSAPDPDRLADYETATAAARAAGDGAWADCPHLDESR